MNALRPWKEGLTIIGQNAAVFRGFSHCKGNLIAHYWCSIFFTNADFLPVSLFSSLCVACVAAFANWEAGWGDGPACVFKNCKYCCFYKK